MLAATALPLFALGAALAQSPQDTGDLVALAVHGADSVLVTRVRERPDDARAAFRQLLAMAAAHRPDTEPNTFLEGAERLAIAHAVAWGDSFFVRQTAHFKSWSGARRHVKVTADSLRLAGNAMIGTAGMTEAMRRWRRSLHLSEEIADTAGIAAALGNLGSGFYQKQKLDSAEVYLTRSRALAEHVGDHRSAGNALGMLASIYKDRGELRAAAEIYRLAADVRARTGDARGLAADRNNLGLVAQDLGDLAAAQSAFEQALATNRQAGRTQPAATNLVNLGNVATLQGDFASAASRYREALAIHRQNGNETEAALVLHNLGMLAVRRGDYRSALSVLSEAAAIYRRTDATADEIVVLRDLVSARAAVGDLQGARAALQRAQALSRAVNAGQRDQLMADLALARGDLEVQFNRLREAEREYARAEQFSRSAGSEATRAAAQQGTGLVLLMREQHSRALRALGLSLQVQVGTGDRRGAALTRLLMGHAERQRGDTATARRLLRSALDTLVKIGDVAGEAAALGALGELEVQARLPLTAESLYHRGLARLGTRRAPAIAWQLQAGLARALAGRGELAEASRTLRAATATIEQVSAPLTIEERRAAYLADKWEVYVDLALVEHARGRPEEAFQASERLRARQMLDLLARGRIASNGSGTLEGREQDLRRRITELTQQVEAPAAVDSGLRGPALAGAERAATLEALARSQEAYGELLIEMREKHPGYAELVHGQVASVAEVKRSLGKGEALLEYLVGDSTTLVFVVTRDTVAAIDLNVSQRTLAALVDFARGTLASPRDDAARQAWRAPLRRLYGILVAPVEARGLLSGTRRLLVAPHAELHYLPFAALVRPGTPDEVLVQRYVVDYVPSASVWLRLQQRPARVPTNSVLALAPRADALPGSRAEVAAIGRIYGRSARILLGVDASERSLRTLASGYDIVHLATYGVLNKHNPLFSFVELGPGGGEDGRLEAHEVFGLALDARLVVLSACQTGLAAGALADVPPGDDWVGLVRTFLYAGASNVLATLWPVEDMSTAQLMERFYGSLASGRSPGEALAAAQREALRNPQTAHPFYWAGFALAVGR